MIPLENILGARFTPVKIYIHTFNLCIMFTLFVHGKGLMYGTISGFLMYECVYCNRFCFCVFATELLVHHFTGCVFLCFDHWVVSTTWLL